MELRDYIEIGSKKAGSLTALGKMLDLSQPTISGVKAHKRTLPIDAAMKLADYIGADLRAVIAANELVTEKKEEKKNYWMQIVKAAETKTAPVREPSKEVVVRGRIELPTRGFSEIFKNWIKKRRNRAVNYTSIFQVMGRTQMRIAPYHAGSLPTPHFL